MTGLKMHWRLIQESDGRTHLNMQWEAAHSGLMVAVLHGRKFTEVRDPMPGCKARGLCPARVHCNVRSKPSS